MYLQKQAETGGLGIAVHSGRSEMRGCLMSGCGGGDGRACCKQLGDHFSVPKARK